MPVASERALRNLAWVEGNRRKVDELTGGKVAYVYLPDTAAAATRSFNRYFFAQVGKQAAIIDERFNGGGCWPTTSSTTLRRPSCNYVTDARGRGLRRSRGGDLRAEGDDHQRVGRLGRRLPAVHVPPSAGSARSSASGPGAGWSASAATRR